MKLIDRIREKLGKKESKIKVRGEISGATWAEVNITNIKGEPVTLGTIPSDLKIRIQTLASGAITFSPQDYRIDNSHGFLHQHSGAEIFPIESKTVSGALLMLLGSDYWELERNN